MKRGIIVLLTHEISPLELAPDLIHFKPPALAVFGFLGGQIIFL